MPTPYGMAPEYRAEEYEVDPYYKSTGIENVPTDTTPAKTTPEKTTVTVGGNAATPADASGNPSFGTYLNLANLNWNQRRLARKYGGQYIDSSGNVNTIQAGTSWADMFKKYWNAKKERNAYMQNYNDRQAAARMGLSVGEQPIANAEARSIYEAGVRNPYSAYSTYSKAAAEEAAKKLYNYELTGYADNDPYAEAAQSVLKALYANKKYDALDSMVNDNGLIDYNGLVNFQKTLAPEGAEGDALSLYSDGKFGKETLQALLAKQFINSDQYNEIGTKLGLPNMGQLKKYGGKMKYFQAGGAINAQQVASDQAQAQQAQLNEIFMAIAKNPKETLQALAQQGVQPKQIIEIVQKMAESNPAAREALSALQQMSQMARQGTKLQYVKRLRGECPEGFEMKMFKSGGVICSKCMRKAEALQNGGKPAKKNDEPESVAKFKEMRCGGKAKRK